MKKILIMVEDKNKKHLKKVFGEDYEGFTLLKKKHKRVKGH